MFVFSPSLIWLITQDDQEEIINIHMSMWKLVHLASTLKSVMVAILYEICGPF